MPRGWRAGAGLESDKKPDGDDEEKKPIPGKAEADRIEGPRHLPPLHELIEQGKVLALNMPAGSNPALARAVGVMLKNAWLQALLMRPARMKESPGVYFRPAVFICDEYQAFASVGEDDPSGDEKSFALTRQCRCIPIVATQSISSLRSVLGSIGSMALAVADAPHPDLPVFERRRIRQDCIGTVRTGGEDQGIVHDQRDLQAGGSLPALRPGRWRRGQHRRDQIIPGATRGGVSPAGLRLAWETARRSACPMTGRSRLSRAGSTSSLTICLSDIPIGERRKQAKYERREWTGTPEAVSTGAGKRSGRFRSQRDYDQRPRQRLDRAGRAVDSVRGARPGRIGPPTGGHPHRPSSGTGSGEFADRRCAPGRRLAGGHLCSRPQAPP